MSKLRQLERLKKMSIKYLNYLKSKRAAGGETSPLETLIFWLTIQINKQSGDESTN